MGYLCARKSSAAVTSIEIIRVAHHDDAEIFGIEENGVCTSLRNSVETCNDHYVTTCSSTISTNYYCAH
uniref:Uncharacterized protein n=1 Tax=Anguilla anguilla TaxID=7936 RepID=A0A0E9VKJ5_ANGAN